MKDILEIVGRVKDERGRRYVVRCIEATELQKAWMPKGGDLLFDQNWGLVRGSNPSVVRLSQFLIDDEYPKVSWSVATYQSTSEKNLSAFKKGRHWIPRQAQVEYLIMNAKKWNSYTLINKFNCWRVNEAPDDTNLTATDYSIEELWLMFYYKVMHNKIWNDVDGWVKAKKPRRTKLKPRHDYRTARG